MQRTNLIKSLNLKWPGLFLLLFGIIIFQIGCSSKSSGSKGNPPSAPTGVTATAGNAQVTLNWNKVSDAAAYNIYWSKTSGVTITNGTKIPNVGNSYTQTGLTNGITCYYIVTAINNSGESAASSEVNAIPSAPSSSGTPPSVPLGVMAVPGNSLVTMSWGSVSGAASYNIYWSASSGVTISMGTKVAGVTSPYTKIGLTNGVPYYCIVTAVNSYGESSPSSEVNATPAASGTPPLPPSGVTATAGNKQVTIGWGSASGATSYDIYWSTSFGVTPANGTKITGVTSPYTQTGLTNGTPYYYVVTAINSYGESAASSQVFATPSSGGMSPSAPTGVVAISFSILFGTGTIYVSWNNVTDATYYNIYYSTTPGVTPATGTPITDVTSGWFVTGLTYGVTYYFIVTAVNNYGESAPSQKASAIAGTPLPVDFNSVSATPGNRQVTISWYDPWGDATSYNIYWSTTPGVTPQNGTKIANIAGTAYTQTGLTNGVTYYYVVTAVNIYGESPPSSEVYATPGSPLPPTGVAATGGDAHVVISWGSVSGATSYNIYWSTTPGVTPQNGIKIANIAGTAYTQTGLTNGVTYYYVVTAVNGYGESAPSAEVFAMTGTLTVSLTFLPTSGTLNAVDLDSMFYESISTFSGSTQGTIDPASMSISISPNNFTFTTELGFSNNQFAGYVDIVPDGFLPAGTTYSVTTSFNTNVGGTIYPVTRYNTFTTVSSAGTNSIVPGDSVIITITGITQPPSLGSILAGNMPVLAGSVVTKTTFVSNTNEGSMILYGGQASSAFSPTDIKPNGFDFPLLAQWDGSYITSTGSTAISVSGITIPLPVFNLSGTLNASGGIDNGTLYAIVHCTDSSCTNLGGTAGPIIAGLIDSNGNMVILGTFSAVANTVPAATWIGGGDTAHTTLVNGIGSGVTTATLEVTTTTSPLLSTATLPFIILAQTDSNNMLSIAADGQGSPALPQSSPVTLTYLLLTPWGTSFGTTAGKTYTSYYLFGLTPALTKTFTP